MIKFRFELRPLDEVSPWGDDEPTLHWFGLTDGWYWLEAGGHELLRRSRTDEPFPYVDYYLARLWEDVTLLTPEVLEPVPADLEEFIASDSAQWAEDPGDESTFTASIWRGEHVLDLGYLRNAPQLRMWRTARDEITIDWRHEDDGEIGFTAGPTVRVSVATTEYVEAVHTLNRELMAAMEQRIDELESRGGLPGVTIDLVDLRRDHQQRQHWFTRNLKRTPVTDWDAVRQGARLLLPWGA